MKNLISIFAILFASIISCKKQQILSVDKKVTNGCVTCKVDAIVIDINGTKNQYYNFDTSFCNVSDTILNDFIQYNTYNGNYIGSEKEIITCKCN